MPSEEIRDDKGGDIGSLSTGILKAILIENLNSEPSERLSLITVKRIVRLIRAREGDFGEHDSIDVAAAWEKFKIQELSGTEEESDGSCDDNRVATSGQTRSNKIWRLRPVLKAAGIAAAVVVGIFAVMIGAQANGIDLFGAIGRWTNETFNFATSQSIGTQDSKAHTGDNNNTTYANIQAALNDCGITEDLAPTWYPENFAISEPRSLKTDYYDNIFCDFNGSYDQFFRIQVRRYYSAADMGLRTFEKDGATVEEYTRNGKNFFIMSNIDTTTATWADGSTLMMSISGNISTDSIKTMIDSIGG